MPMQNTLPPVTDLPSVTLDEARVVAGIEHGFDNHGVYDSRGGFAGQSAIRQGDWLRNGRAEAALLDAIPRRLEGEYIYGGYVPNHYGHLLIETFSRLHVFQDSDLPVVFSELNHRQSALFWRLVRAWGLDRERIVLLDAPAVIERLTVPPPTLAIRNGIKPLYARAYERLGGQIARRHGVTENSDPTPVYLSRTKVPATGRHFFGETIIETVLARQGAEIVHMQDLTLLQQILLGLTRTTFHGFAGTAFHNLVFAAAPKRITFFTAGPLNGNFRLIERVKRNDWRRADLDCAAKHPDGPKLLTPEAIAGACRACGVTDESAIAEALEDYPAAVRDYEAVAAELDARAPAPGPTTGKGQP